MSLVIRPIEQNDAEGCGRIGYESHKAISSVHGYPSEQPSEEYGIGLIRSQADESTFCRLFGSEMQIEVTRAFHEIYVTTTRTNGHRN